MTRARPRPGTAEAGFTLIEVMVSLGLMALITLAGFTMLQGILGARERTEGRLERLADQQRAMFVLTQDFEEIADGPLTLVGAEVAFNRHGSVPGPTRLPVVYGLNGPVLERRLGAAGAPQRLLGGVTAVQWRFFSPQGGWREAWPPVGEPEDARPRAVAVEIALAGDPGGPGGTLRRVVELPAAAKP